MKNGMNKGAETAAAEAGKGDELRRAVRDKYAAIAATRPAVGQGPSGCGSGEQVSLAGISQLYSMVGESYAGIEGHEVAADLGLGCGIPTRLAALAAGETVVDLGSGAGNDAFVARAAVGAEGRVIGLDFTDEMIASARSIAAERGFDNVEFVHGEIEAMPLAGDIADIVISNCVLNLVPDKRRAFEEMFRIIRPGGRFCVSDVVVDGPFLPGVRESLEAYVGCIGGAIERELYLELLGEAGFVEIEIAAEHRIAPPREILSKAFDRATIDAYHAGKSQIASVTVRGRKPQRLGE